MRPDLAHAFVLVVRTQRTKVGLSQEELAHRAGLHRTYVSMIERGIRNPTLVVLRLLSQALGTSMVARNVSTTMRQPLKEIRVGQKPRLAADGRLIQTSVGGAGGCGTL